MKNVFEARQLPEQDKVYLKKDFLGWRVIEPWKDPETGKINWFNLILGGKKNLIILIVVLILVGFIYLGASELISNYDTIVNNPCAFCRDCFRTVGDVTGAVTILP